MSQATTGFALVLLFILKQLISKGKKKLKPGESSTNSVESSQLKKKEIEEGRARKTRQQERVVSVGAVRFVKRVFSTLLVSYASQKVVGKSVQAREENLNPAPLSV